MMLEEGVMAYIGGLGGPVEGLLSMFEIGARPLEGAWLIRRGGPLDGVLVCPGPGE